MIRSAVVALGIALAIVDFVRADIFGVDENTFEIEFVTIGDPGNPADTTGAPNPAGSVDYTYRMGKYEISEGMIDKVNAIAGLGLTHGGRGSNKPATAIDLVEAAKFVNWLNASTGAAPAYKISGDGAFQLWQFGDLGFDSANPYRNSQSRYFLPSMDEWYKAAYYDPVAEVYYDYPTGSDNPPDGIDFEGDTSFDAVYFDGGSNLEPNDVTNVGVPSPYGTVAQGGNVWEWEETDYDLGNGPGNEPRIVRGGNWYHPAMSLLSSYYMGGRVDPPDGDDTIGIRVASVGPNSDANGDGHIDGTDYLIWAAAYGNDPAAIPPGPPLNGDFDYSGVVDGLDYLVWAGNYGQGPNDAVAVPEPATFSGLLVAAALLSQCQHRRRWH
ncbi:MAG: SUMF1/EgtB/PvdO family nonheme iron enzyme [Pirellulales bacterium]